jgi:beta-glucanase (GH16 family)
VQRRLFRPFVFLPSFAVGGTWPGLPDATTVFSAEMQVDYVRVYTN